jgi:AraC-like DNA-binding protein
VTISRYVELAPAPDLAEYVQCVWYRRVSSSEAERPARIVPDGCMDLIWGAGGFMVAGPDMEAWTGPLTGGVDMVGIRFRPGMAPPLLRIPAAALVGQRAALDEVSREWARDIDRLQADASLSDTGSLLQASLRARARQSPEVDRAAQYVASALRRPYGESTPRVDDLADAVGLSERQLNRRCQEAFGYGPKLLARILRFQQFLALTDASALRPLAHLATDAGYADQAHLSREVIELSGLTPAKLLAERGRR